MSKKHRIWLAIAMLAVIGFNVTACNDDGENSKSGKTVCSHNFGEWEIIAPSTADKDGVEIRTCTKCGHTERRSIPAGTGNIECNHVYHEWIITTPATATQDGEQTRHCTKCGLKQTHTLPATGDTNCDHSFGEWETTREPTCDQEGERERNCTKCPAKDIDLISALEHAYGEWATTLEPTAEEDGEETRTCSQCGHHEKNTLGALGNPECPHYAYSEWTVIKTATCTEDGERERTCANCPHKEVDFPKAFGHAMTETWAITSDPSCISEGVERKECQRCEYFETQPIVALGHDDGKWHITLHPTCVAKGEKDLKCTRCDHVLNTDDIAIDENEHDIETVDGLAPTCLVDGYGTIRCKRTGCSYAVVNGDTIPKRGHHFIDDDWEVATAATCTTAGLEERFCTHNCGETGSRETRPIAINPAAHDWNSYSQTLTPTCTAAGTETRTCKHNAAHTETMNINALGHNFTQWQETTAPTCTTAAIDTEKCSRCSVLGTATKIGRAALGHDFTQWQETTAPTCTTAAIDTERCSRCSVLGTVTKTGSIDVSIHAFTEWQETTMPTCTTTAIETEKCSRCSVLGTKTQIGRAAFGHNFTQWQETIAPTCIAAAIETEKCERCFALGFVTKTGRAALGHSWDWAKYNKSTGLVSCTRTGCSGGSASVGDTGPAGGKIFYVAALGFTVTGTGSFTAYYLEAAPVNQGTSIKWCSCTSYDYGYCNIRVGALGSTSTGTAIGTGKENTAGIIAGHFPTETASINAAKACADYRGGGYNDWFLPSKDELNELYKVRPGMINNYFFWSSTQNSGGYSLAWVQYFFNGNQSTNTKTAENYVRAVRAF